MLSETAITLLMQIPLAGVVVFVVMVFLKHIEKADTVNTQVLKDLTDQIAKTSASLLVHDEKTDAYLLGMQRRLAGNKKK